MAPQSPEADRWLTWFYYTQGSEAFKGDLYFYSVDHDLRGKLGEIDGEQMPGGDDDRRPTTTSPRRRTANAPPADQGRLVHRDDDIGHFPMSENHAVFRRYLIQALEDPAGQGRSSVADRHHQRR